jgi:hypothetical protein
MRLVQAAFIILLCSCLSCVPDVETAYSHNLALAPSLIGAKNACHAQERTPSDGDLFVVADARIVSILPQAGNVTSDLSNASILWSYSASFPPQARFSIGQDARCPAGEIRYFSPSPISFSGTLSYHYGNSSETLQLSSLGPNPVPLNLSEGKLTEGDFSNPYASLQVFLDASISVAYQFSKTHYSYGCTGIGGGYIGCGCTLSREMGVRTFQKSISHARNFSVEAGPVFALWLNPPLASRLDGAGEGKVAFFARRMPARISFSFAGMQVGKAQPYSFSMHTGVCGEKIAEREFNMESGDVFLNTSAPLFPFQLVGKNASYIPFYAEFPWAASAGKAEFETVFQDAFSHEQVFLRNFTVRRPAEFLEYGSARAPILSGAMETRSATDDATASAYPPQQQSAAFPDFSVLAVAFSAPLCIGAFAICRHLQWL